MHDGSRSANPMLYMLQENSFRGWYPLMEGFKCLEPAQKIRGLASLDKEPAYASGPIQKPHSKGLYSLWMIVRHFATNNDIFSFGSYSPKHFMYPQSDSRMQHFIARKVHEMRQSLRNIDSHA